MRIVRHPAHCPEVAKRSAVALGNFDGVHRGHQAVINKAIEIAKAEGVPSAVMTFEPHPLRVIKPEIPPLRITPFKYKARLIEALGVDILFCLHFTKAFSKTSADDFVNTILVRDLSVTHIITGHDFIFGHNRGGNIALLKDMATTHGYSITQVEPVTDNDEIFSSTLIRQHIWKGNFAAASQMLGHDYLIEGRVRVGAGRGQDLGIPTANILLKNHIHPPNGIYVAEVNINTENRWQPAILYIGNNPTFADEQHQAEVHIFDHLVNLYGKTISIRPLQLIREDKAFDNVDTLKKQMEEDCQHARQYFQLDHNMSA